MVKFDRLTTFFTAEELNNLPPGEYIIEEFQTITVKGTTVIKETKYKVKRTD